MTREPLRIGIVGLGGMGYQHALTIGLLDDAQVVAGCDPFPEQIAKWRERVGDPSIATYGSLEEMLNSSNLDIAIIATHADLHHPQTIACLEAGVHVLCEKPPAQDLVLADEMVAAAEHAGRRLAVNHIKRGSLGTSLALGLIDDGAIGEPYLIRGEGKGRRWAGSELFEMGTHLFDWLRALFGNVEWLFANLIHEGRRATATDIIPSRELPYPEKDVGLVLGQRAFCSLGMTNGLHADIGFLFQPDVKDVGYGFDIVGTEGTLALRRSVGTRLFVQKGWHRGPLTDHPWEEIPLDEWDGVPLETREPEARLACQYRITRDFVAAVRENRESITSGRDGRDALELVMAVWESSRIGAPVQLPLVERTHPLHRWKHDGRP